MDLRIAFYIASTALGSHDWMTIRRGSGVEMPAICRRRVWVPW